MSARKTTLTNTLMVMAIGLTFAFATSMNAQPLPPNHVDDFTGKPRVVVLTDMGNEPDDQMSFVRLLLYANELDLEALGKLYPRFAFIMEGDTPSFLGLTNNGLNSYRNPSWGGWGGRYIYRQPYGETHPLWTQGGDLFPRITSQDSVVGMDGKTYVSDQATIWRWRTAFQREFAARMDWTIKPYAQANHNPQLVVNGKDGTAPIIIDAEVGRSVTLDASQSKDPDGDKLSYQWFHYEEASFFPGINLSIDSTWRACYLLSG
jgi:hypothetical protein